MFSEEQVINVEFLPNDIVDGATYIIKQSNPNSYTHGMFKKVFKEREYYCI